MKLAAKLIKNQLTKQSSVTPETMLKRSTYVLLFLAALTIVSCGEDSPTKQSKDPVNWREAPEKVCKKLQDCLGEGSGQRGISMDDCVKQYKAVLKGSAKKSEGNSSENKLSAEQRKFARQCAQSMMQASCTELMSNAVAELPGCNKLSRDL